MKKSLLSFLVLTLVFAACNREMAKPDPDPNANPTPGQPNQPNQGTMYLSKYITRNDSILIDYNTDKVVTRHANISPTQPSLYSRVYYMNYDGGKLKSFNYSNDPADKTGRLDKTIEYTGNQISKVTVIGGSGAYYTISYNSAGQMTERKYFQNQTDPAYIIATYTWENNNLVKQQDLYVKTNETVTKLFKYDNKPNAFKGISVMFYHQFYDEVYLSANNVVEKSYDDVESYSYTSTFVYTYNSKNYPTSRTETQTGKSDGVITIRTERFEYVE